MAQSKARSGRSPSYPAINLETAMEKARIVFEKEGRNPAPISALITHWGFKSATGPALRTVAALIKFGLLEDKGRRDSREAKLTELALEVILDDREDSSNRDRAIRRIALVPEVHSELWQKYEGNLPSDDTLRFYLQRDMRFSRPGADALIREFRDTITFAKLHSPDNISSEGGDLTLEGDEHPSSPDDIFSKASNNLLGGIPMSNGAADKQTITIVMPIVGGLKAAIQVPESMNEQQWSHMMAMLKGMKDGLVVASRESGMVTAPE